MTRSPLAIVATLAAAMGAAPVTAANVSQTGTVSLTPAEIEAAIGTRAAARPEPIEIGTSAPGVHGEVGFEIGSNGSRAVFGSAIMPIGSTGYVAISFLQGQDGRRRHR